MGAPKGNSRVSKPITQDFKMKTTLTQLHKSRDSYPVLHQNPEGHGVIYTTCCFDLLSLFSFIHSLQLGSHLAHANRDTTCAYIHTLACTYIHTLTVHHIDIHTCKLGHDHEWSRAGKILSACEKTPRKQEKSLVASVSSELGTVPGMCFRASPRCESTSDFLLQVATDFCL